MPSTCAFDESGYNGFNRLYGLLSAWGVLCPFENSRDWCVFHYFFSSGIMKPMGLLLHKVEFFTHYRPSTSSFHQHQEESVAWLLAYRKGFCRLTLPWVYCSHEQHTQHRTSWIFFVLWRISIWCEKLIPRNSSRLISVANGDHFDNEKQSWVI